MFEYDEELYEAVKILNEVYIIPKIEDRPVKFICNDTKCIINEQGDFVITRPATLSEIAELFDIPIQELLNEKVKLGVWQSN